MPAHVGTSQTLQGSLPGQSLIVFWTPQRDHKPSRLCSHLTDPWQQSRRLTMLQPQCLRCSTGASQDVHSWLLSPTNHLLGHVQLQTEVWEAQAKEATKL